MKHTLKYEGAPHDDQGNRIVLGRWAGVGGVGHAKCSCGELSEEFGSSKIRQAWHRRHKHVERVREFLTFEAEGRVWPFTEDERCNITGYGHQDKAEFAQALNDYDQALGADPADGVWKAGDFGHKYAILEFLDEDLVSVRAKTDDDQPITPDTHPECIPITTLWGQR